VKKPFVNDCEPPLIRERSKMETVDYIAGFTFGLSPGEFDESQSSAWQLGWADAQE
jgi:hypothetical protein